MALWPNSVRHGSLFVSTFSISFRLSAAGKLDGLKGGRQGERKREMDNGRVDEKEGRDEGRERRGKEG